MLRLHIPGGKRWYPSNQISVSSIFLLMVFRENRATKPPRKNNWKHIFRVLIVYFSFRYDPQTKDLSKTHLFQIYENLICVKFHNNTVSAIHAVYVQLPTKASPLPINAYAFHCHSGVMQIHYTLHLWNIFLNRKWRKLPMEQDSTKERRPADCPERPSCTGQSYRPPRRWEVLKWVLLLWCTLSFCCYH